MTVRTSAALLVLKAATSATDKTDLNQAADVKSSRSVRTTTKSINFSQDTRVRPILLFDRGYAKLSDISECKRQFPSEEAVFGVMPRI